MRASTTAKLPCGRDEAAILFGSDAPTAEAFLPKAAWAAFRTLPLTEAEFQTIAGNVPPYMR